AAVRSVTGRRSVLGMGPPREPDSLRRSRSAGVIGRRRSDGPPRVAPTGAESVDCLDVRIARCARAVPEIDRPVLLQPAGRDRCGGPTTHPLPGPADGVGPDPAADPRRRPHRPRRGLHPSHGDARGGPRRRGRAGGGDVPGPRSPARPPGRRPARGAHPVADAPPPGAAGPPGRVAPPRRGPLGGADDLRGRRGEPLPDRDVLGALRAPGHRGPAARPRRSARGRARGAPRAAADASPLPGGVHVLPPPPGDHRVPGPHPAARGGRGPRSAARVAGASPEPDGRPGGRGPPRPAARTAAAGPTSHAPGWLWRLTRSTFAIVATGATASARQRRPSAVRVLTSAT